ncbi:outer membrane protein assembly factor BamE [Alcaligenaceae bacterium]|nr:outer membrane protein assembly factor BamE [Alcaligenaceae bacterium]
MITVLLVLKYQGRLVLTITNTFSKILRAGVAGGALVLALSACGSTEWGFPYRPNIQQGNWITAEQVDRLQPGMSREQVRFLLGTPTLQDIFRSDRWDYPYYSKPGYGEAQQRRFSVWFEGDSLARWEGDAPPDRQPFQKTDTGSRAAGASGGETEITPASTDRGAEPLR